MQNPLIGIGPAYHFGGNPDGSVYIMGNIDSQRAHTSGWNHLYIGYCFLGNLHSDDPTAGHLEGWAKFSAWLQAQSERSHREFVATACPGDRILAALGIPAVRALASWSEVCALGR